MLMTLSSITVVPSEIYITVIHTIGRQGGPAGGEVTLSRLVAGLDGYSSGSNASQRPFLLGPTKRNRPSLTSTALSTVLVDLPIRTATCLSRYGRLSRQDIKRQFWRFHPHLYLHFHQPFYLQGWNAPHASERKAA